MRLPLVRSSLVVLGCLLGASLPFAQAPPYSLLIKGGHVIDPRNAVDGVFDIAIADGTIAQVAPETAGEPGADDDVDEDEAAGEVDA